MRNLDFLENGSLFTTHFITHHIYPIKRDFYCKRVFFKFISIFAISFSNRWNTSSSFRSDVQLEENPRNVTNHQDLRANSMSKFIAILFIYFITIHRPSRFEPILSRTPFC